MGTRHTVEEFTERAGEYGVTVRDAREGSASDAIRDALEEPAVGVPLDWAGLPASVDTQPTAADLEAAVTGVTPAAGGIADYGSLVLRADGSGTEPVSLFVNRHVAVLRAETIRPDMEHAFEWLDEETGTTRDSFVIATGPSATADMGALVQGAHGPRTVEVVLV